MTDSRRRSTMQPPSQPDGIRSGIPQPSTVKKQVPNTMRMSLAGPALRAPYLAPPPTNPRQSMMRSQDNPLLQSTSKQNYGRTPMKNNARRGSMWTGGAIGSQPSSSQPIKDPRPLREKPYQARMRQDILAYLQATEFEITMQTLANIHGKGYRAIFEHLVLLLDPSYPFNEHARLEDQFIPTLKALRYPFVHVIDNKWLAAPASMHSWPSLLGVLHWLVELCKMREEYLCSGHPTIQNPETIPEEFDNPFDHQALAFQYYDETYTVWLNHVDDFVEQNQILEDRYAKKNERVQADLENVSTQLKDAQKECTRLESSAAPIVESREENQLLIVDSKKMQSILEKWEVRTKKLADTIVLEKADLEARAADLEALQRDQARLSDIVKTQNLSPEEVIQMNTDHEKLSRSLEDLKQKIAEAHKAVMAAEVSVTKRAAAAEETVDAYNNLLSSLELFPPLPPPWEDVDLTLELNTAASNPQLLLSGSDIRRVIRPTLFSVAEAKRSERATLESERIKVDNELDQLSLECENVDEEIGEVEKKVVGLNDQADDLRDAAQQEALVANGEAQRLERDLAQARTAALANGMGVKSRLQAIQFDYREQIEKVSRLKEETVRAIIKNSHDIAMFKEEVSRHLRELREFPESEP
ncbi:HEC/Ndc80p family-domain-containing protein [Infundibulicybe gibba]|nr:HEC/Ndc80p family-domain-containing protein [Infundibulicybe gibba]